MRHHKHRATEEVQLTAAEVASVEEAFDIFDTDGSGLFDMDELEVAIRALGIQVEPEEMQRIFAVIDSDGSGKVDKEEYKMAIAICKSAKLGHHYSTGVSGVNEQNYSTRREQNTRIGDADDSNGDKSSHGPAQFDV